MKLYKFLLLIFGIILLTGCGSEKVGTGLDSPTGDHGAYLTVRDMTFEVEVVDSLDDQIKGLSWRESLEEDEGMLFIYDISKKRRFWMKDMKFGLDIIFINDGIVVDIVLDLPAPVGDEEPMGYTSKEVSDMVLEVNAGVVDKYGVEVGDGVDIVWDK